MKPIVAALTAALCLLTVTLPAQQTAPGLPYTVISRTGRQPLAVRSINNQEMFALDDLTRLFGLTVREDPLAGGLTVTAGGQTIALSAQQPLASVGGRMISLSTSPVREGRTWYVPVDFVARALAGPAHIELRKTSRLVVVGDVRMPRVAARVEPLGSLTRVTIDVAPATPHTVTQDGSHLLVKFDADALDTSDFHTGPATDTVQALHASDTPPVITLDLGPRFATYRAADQPGTNGAGRIVLDLPAQAEPTQQPAAPSPGQPSGQPTAPPEPPPLLDLPPPGGLHAIVIDPGHGGDDAGVKGAQGTVEKTLTLTVARRLKATLEARLGIRVLLTRDTDVSVAPDQRAAMANNNKADLFVSLHVNASLRPAATGAQIWYSNLEGFSEEARRNAHAGAETLPVLGGGSREIDIIPWEQAQGRFVEQSGALARTIDAALRQRVPMAPRGVQQAPLRVLVGLNMPAVLVEMGFLSNPEQEHQLVGDEYQNTVVSALADAIVRFRSTAGGGTP